MTSPDTSTEPFIAFQSERQRIPAWLFSLGFHVILLTTIGLVARRVQTGTQSEPDRPVGIAVVQRMPDRDVYSQPQIDRPTEAIFDDAGSSASNSQSAASLAPANIAPPIDLDGVMATMTAGAVPSVQIGELEGAFGTGTDTTGQGSRTNVDGKPTTAMLFGVSGSGSRFVYVFDRSDSMNGYDGKPLRAAKSELKRSLQSMTEAQEFQIVFYNETAKPFVPAGSPVQLLRGDASMIRRAINYIDVVKAFGGTEHYDALKLALRMGPDVIFLLTDARVPSLSGKQMSEIKRMAERTSASIHCIEFGAESLSPDDNFLRQLAADNRGEYRYLSLSELSSATALTFDRDQTP